MKKIKELSIKKLMVALFIININVFLIVILCGYYQQRSRIVAQNDKNFTESLFRINLSMQQKCKSYNNIIEKIAYSNIVQDYLETDSQMYHATHYTELKSLVWDFISEDETIKDLAIFGTNGIEFNISGDLRQLSQVFNEIPENKLYYYTEAVQLSFDQLGRNQRTCIIVGAYIYSTSTFDQENPIGLILMSIDAQRLFGIKAVNEKMFHNLILFARDGSVIYDGSGNDNWKYEDFFDENGTIKSDKIRLGENTFYVKTENLPYLDGKAVLAVSNDRLFQDTDIVRRNQIIIMILALLVEIPLFYMVVCNITLPLNHFISFLNRIEDGDIRAIKEKADVEGPKEIRILQINFNQMLGEINALNHRLVRTTMSLYEMEMDKKQAELEYLYAQINPHFLFNTLESIKGCAVTEEAWKSYRMLDALGMLFRYSIKMDSEVYLSEELHLVKNYLFIQKMRFGNKLEYCCDVPKNLENYRIPKMILQPIVENAIVHGIEMLSEGGQIYIEGEPCGNNLILRVQNDGPVIDEERCRELRQWLEEETPKKDSGKSYHIGIQNVNKRLKYTYEAGGIRIFPRKNGGLTVELRMWGEKKSVQDITGG